VEQLLKGTTAYKILEGDCDADKLSHAYMLDFPDLKNLKAALVIFALRFFGARTGTSLYQRIINESYTDLKIYPSEGKKLDAQTVGQLLEDSAMRPIEGDKKLYVIVGFDGASALIQNKLLKTLEEPLSGVHFLLGVTSLAPVLDTVKSRVKLLEIPPFTESQIFEVLERDGHKQINEAAAKSANGVLGAAQNMASGGWFEAVLQGAREICNVKNVSEIGAIAYKYGDTKYKNELLNEMQRLYFTALKEGTGLPLCRGALVYALENITKAFADVKFNAFFQGLLYDFMLRVVKENNRWQKLQQ